MSRIKLLVAMASLLAVVATVQGLNIRVPFLVEVPKRPAPVETPHEDEGPIRWTVKPAQGAAVAGSEMDVLITLEAAHVPSTKRAPINLALVIDRSGSMSERRKLDYAKAAAHIAIDQLTPVDRVAIVAFDSVSTVMLPSAPVADRAALHAVVDSLTPGGSTNISGGLLDGIAEVKRNLKRDHVNRVMLLTDGLSNFGETTVEAFGRIAGEASAAGITVSTMGLGAEFSEDALVTIAEHSGGRYYYIENPEQMSAIFRGEVQGMQAVVARDVKVQLGWTAASVESVIGYRGPAVAPGAPLALGDMYSGQTRTLVVRVRLTGMPAGGGPFLSPQLTYTAAATRKQYASVRSASVQLVNDPSKVSGTEDRETLAKVESVRAGARLEEAMTQLDRGDRAGAMRLLSEQVNATRSLNQRVLRSQRLVEQINQMEAALRRVDGLSAQTDEYRSYVKQQKAAAYELTR